MQWQNKISPLLTRLFDKLILSRPGIVVCFLLILICFLGYHAKDFKIDASADTLLLENDKDLHYWRLISDRYGIEDYLILTFSPNEDLFSDNTLATLARLRNELKQLERVSSVVSILDVPLLESPPVPIKDLVNNIMTLESPAVDRELARIEFKNSPIYQDLLVSPDLKVTALQIVFKQDAKYQDLLNRRNYFREKKANGMLSEPESLQYEKVAEELQRQTDNMKDLRHVDIMTIRKIMDKYRQDGQLFLGGVSMIADDMIAFIKNDLKMFGIGVLFFLIITLSIIFKKMRWVLLPILCCAFSVVSMMGLLGIFGWKVTVISSNFISLQLIITMAITIHLIVRYRELHYENPEAEHRKLVLDTIRLMFKPCLFTSLTTIAGFGSLLLCNIRPVRTFGWMMGAGIMVSLILTFLFFPSEVMLLKKGKPALQGKSRISLANLFGKFTEAHGTLIMLASVFVLTTSIIGMSRLEVENCFIDYFKDTTEIYQGMKLIDQKLGGTTPLDVIVEFDESVNSVQPDQSTGAPTDYSESEFDEFDEFDESAKQEKYWFTADKMAFVMRIHDYLNSIPVIGKVLSLGTMLKVAEKLNGGKPLTNFQLALLYSEIPKKFKEMILKPFVSIENNEVRFSVRVRDSEKSLRRNELLHRIRHDLTNKLDIKKDHVHLAGMLVLYNNILQSLFSSQIMTLGITLLALMCMFLILFRSLKISIIAIFPNLLSIVAVLGFMGWVNIHLDMMTITIAAISMGIAVDDTIHYIHRFKREFQKEKNYINTLHRCHGTIGHAMYYTSLTIVIGFSILALSNFIPTIYFGLLTGLAMVIALIAALTLLPQLIIFFKPFGPES